MVFPLLLLGHVVADFWWQSRWMARCKANSRAAFGAHIAVVALAHALCAAPILYDELSFVLLASVVGVHALVDLLKGLLENRYGPALRFFMIDQGLHVAACGVAALLWPTAGTTPLAGLLEGHEDALRHGAALAALVIFNARGGAVLVALLLQGLRLGASEAVRSDADDDAERRDPPHGATIGVLERWITVILVLSEAWGGLGLILGAKSLARFKELEDQRFAEYYLIGTLSSVLVAVASTLFVRATCL